MKHPNLKPKKVHLIGIGGSALNYLAQILNVYEFDISGCDLSESENIEILRSKNIDPKIGHSPDHITKDLDEVIISSAITEKSPAWIEVQKAKSLKIPVVKRTYYWKKLMRCGKGIAISGTHGKTTTTAMIGVILQEAGFDPTVMVGGFVPEFNGTVRIGKLDYIVVEADEYDRAFLSTAPQISVITNINADHLDSYPNGLPEIRQAFKKFIRLLPAKTGILVANGKDQNIRQIAKSFDLKYRFYDEDRLWPGLKLKIPGLHNRLNATAAARVAHELGIKQKIIIKALNNFSGVARRQELIGKIGQTEIYDDYAHLPQEIEATIKAFREKFPDKRILVIFQPHQKRRTQENLEELARVLKLSDQSLVAPLYFVAGREDDIEISSVDIAIATNDESGKIIAYNDWELFFQKFEELIPKYDIVIIMGAGDLSQKIKEKYKLGNEN